MDLDISGEKGLVERKGIDSGKNWTLQKNWLQGVDIGRLAGLFEGSNKKSVYKLVLHDLTVKDSQKNVEERAIKGAFGLIKATWGKEKGKWEVEKIEVNDANKVWLIMAQGQSSMYLIPVVRTAGWWGGEGKCTSETKSDEAKKQVEGSGVEDIKSWTFDKSKEWNKLQDGNLKKLMGSGFSITRRIEAIIFGGRMFNGKRSGEVNYDKYLEEYKKQVNGYQFTWAGRVEHLYKNAGVLDLTSISKEAKSCHEIEHYFPLDLVVLGDTSTVSKRGAEYTGLNQKITIKDTISQVIGVNY